MTERERFPDGRISEHIVQLFDSDESRAHVVAGFLADGLTGGARILIVVKARHWPAVTAQLTGRGIDVAAGVASGAIRVLDALHALDTFMNGDRPDRERFRVSIGSLVADLSNGDGAPPHIYGEMVEVLAEMANFAGAAQVEAFWNELAREYPFILLCGYSSDHFGPECNTRALHTICRAHTRIQSLPNDPLGAWLTSAAHG